MKKDILILTALFTLFTGLLYGYQYFFGAGGMTTIYKNWDGPSYVIIADSLYQPSKAASLNIINSPAIRPDWTFLPAHFPLYPLLIRLFSGIGYFQAMLALSLLGALLAILALYNLLKSNHLVKNPLLATIPFILLSPRWFIVSHVGGSESWFMVFFIMFLNNFLKRLHWQSAIFAALALATRPQGTLIGIGVLVLALYQLKNISFLRLVKTYYPYLLLPLTMLVIFFFYKLQTGSFWAFFSAISIFGHSSLLPFSTFSYPSVNVETFWQEVNALDYVFYFFALILLLKSKIWQLGVIGLIFFAPLPFLHHSDISRYAIPLLPLAFIAFKDIVATKEFNFATLLMSPAILRYAINFMEFNHGA